MTPPTQETEPPGWSGGFYTVTMLRPGSARPGSPPPVVEHWAYDDRGAALTELGTIPDRVPPGTELVLRDPDGIDLLRVARVA